MIVGSAELGAVFPTVVKPNSFGCIFFPEPFHKFLEMSNVERTVIRKMLVVVGKSNEAIIFVE